MTEPLTDEQIYALAEKNQRSYGTDMLGFARAIEGHLAGASKVESKGWVGSREIRGATLAEIAALSQETGEAAGWTQGGGEVRPSPEARESNEQKAVSAAPTVAQEPATPEPVKVKEGGETAARVKPPMRTLTDETGTCLQHGLRLCSGEVQAEISPQAMSKATRKPSSHLLSPLPDSSGASQEQPPQEPAAPIEALPSLDLAKAVVRSAGYSLVTTDFIIRFADFIQDWRKGDFELPNLAALDVESCVDAWQDAQNLEEVNTALASQEQPPQEPQPSQEKMTTVVDKRGMSWLVKKAEGGASK